MLTELGVKQRVNGWFAFLTTHDILSAVNDFEVIYVGNRRVDGGIAVSIFGAEQEAGSRVQGSC